MNNFTTRIASQVLGMEKELDTIEASNLADLIVVENNPLENVDLLLRTEAICLVMQGEKLVKGEW